MADAWYYTTQGQQQGPAAGSELKQLAASGRLLPTDLVWKEGMANWTSARSMRGLFPQDQLAPAPAPVLPAALPAPVHADRVEPIEEETTDYDRVPRRRRSRRHRGGLSAGTWAALIGGGIGVLLLIGAVIVAAVLLGGQGTSRSWSLGQGEKVTYQLRFTAGKKAELWVTSNRDTDVDLFVIDSMNRPVAADEGDSKDCYVWFIPASTQIYTVEVQNRVRLEPFLQHRNGANSGILRFKESDQAAPGPVAMPPPQPIPQPPPAALAAAPQVIPLQAGPDGATHQSVLVVTDGKDAAHMNTYCKVYTYPMSAGKVYTIDLQSIQFDAYLRLEDEAGRELAWDDDSGGDLNARIVHVPAQDGTYRIIATTFGPNEVGAFTLTIRP